MAFVFRAVDEVGATLNARPRRHGRQARLLPRRWPTPAPLTPAALAEATGTGEHYAREWLNAQAAGVFVDLRPRAPVATPCRPSTRSRSPTRPARRSCPASSRSPSAPSRTPTRIVEAARDGAGVGWHEHNTDVHDGCERFFRPGYNANLVAEWLPALDGRGRQARARRHGRRRRLRPRRLDDPDGAGLPGIAVRRLGLPRGVHRGRAAARGRGRRRRPGRLRGRPGARVPGRGYDLVTMFDALHDMGDPVGAARHVHDALADDGTWMIVEPMAGDRVEDNLNPVGRAYYGFSTLLCTPASLSQDVGLALGTQAGPARIRDVTTAAGFTASGPPPRPRSTSVFEVRQVTTVHVDGPATPATPTPSGAVERDGVRHRPCATGRTASRRRPTVLLMPTWSIVPSRLWKAQVAYLARHYRVVTFDGRGSGRSGRPRGGGVHRRASTPPTPWRCWTRPAPSRPCWSGFSCGAAWAVHVAADHPDRVLGIFAIAPAVRPRARHHGPRRRCPGTTARRLTTGWAQVQQALLARAAATTTSCGSSSARCSPSRTRPSRSRTAVGVGARDRRRRRSSTPTAGRLRLRRRRLRPLEPLLRRRALPGDGGPRRPTTGSGRTRSASGWPSDRRLAGARRGRRARAAGARPGAGQPRDPTTSSSSCAPPAPSARRPGSAPYAGRKRALVPLLADRARPRPARPRDRRRAAQARTPTCRSTGSPSTRSPGCSRPHGERVHPASRWLANESAHIEDESAEHDLHAFQAIRRMDEILVNNFMVFDELVERRSTTTS